MANQEHLEILKQGVEAWNNWRVENLEIESDLSGANLSKADLSKAKYLRAEDLIGALNWRDAILDSSIRVKAENLVRAKK